MTNHKIIRKETTTSCYFFRQEVAIIECEKTNKLFPIVVFYNYNEELDKFDDPECSYSYCPHCAEKLDFKE